MPLLIGDPVIEANNHVLYAALTHACRFTSVAGGDITDFYLYIGNVAGTSLVDPGVYANDAVNNRPGALLYSGLVPQATVALTWLRWAGIVGWTILNATTYWLGWAGSGIGTNSNTRYKAGSAVPSNQYMLANGRWPNPFGAPAGSAAREVSVYGWLTPPAVTAGARYPLHQVLTLTV